MGSLSRDYLYFYFTHPVLIFPSFVYIYNIYFFSRKFTNKFNKEYTLIFLRTLSIGYFIMYKLVCYLPVKQKSVKHRLRCGNFILI